ncbi:MAG: heparinase II/III domain-containing protein, partial [Flavobacteriaceae bacterium]
FGKQIDWNYGEFKKLWTYNLTYFDYLNQSNIVIDEGIELLHDFIDNYSHIKDGKEPYPVSLRLINVVKFISYNNIKDTRVDDLVYSDTKLLLNRLEYHLLANHLLENGFALLFASYYLQDQNVFNESTKILKNQLNEQILGDGAHFELSPMYHQLMLYRVMDCIQLIRLNPDIFPARDLELLLVNRAELMRSWLESICFNNGAIPLFNDSANNINPTTLKLGAYADFLKINFNKVSLKESMFRSFEVKGFELKINCANIMPSYQPGHSHADTFTFELSNSGLPFIVDTGLSTYNIGNRRSIERATSSHNTVTLNEINSSNIWSGFRVANRANVSILSESKNRLLAEHDGYKRYGVVHRRLWDFNSGFLKIKDNLVSKSNNKVVGIAYFHLHPNVEILEVLKNEVITNNGTLSFIGFKAIEICKFHYAPEFNKLIPSNKIVVKFISNLETILKK